uniref:RNase H type-1 domain-containing protein n=1 Tax=Noccaea caerulescens TaxID=107243 RepID=A0A1J3ELU2_NOCCA
MSRSVYTNLFRIFTISKNHPLQAETEPLGPWILWRLWKTRNDWIIKGTEYDALQTIKKATEDMEEWKSRKENQGSLEIKNPMPTNPLRESWKPPPSGWVKCNVDGTWNKDAVDNGIGWVLRDSKGDVLWIGGRKISRLSSILEVEIEALRWAILVTSNFNYDNIIFETDSKEAVEALSSDEGWPKLRTITQDIHHLLAKLNHHKIIFQPRDGNFVADRIAKESLSNRNYDPKLYSSMPNWIIPLVDVDKQSCIFMG